eukprot:m51a1_g7420 hypothetical protein (145) ;mRNA; f:87-521
MPPWGTHWGPCNYTEDCGLRTKPKNTDIACRVGDRRCINIDECNWANWVDHLARDCSIAPSCSDGVWSPNDGETDVDCGGRCVAFGKTCSGPNLRCNSDRDCDMTVWREGCHEWWWQGDNTRKTCFFPPTIPPPPPFDPYTSQN